MSVYYCSLMLYKLPALDSFFFFNDTATTEIYTLSLHDALPIFDRQGEILHHTRTAMNPAGSAAEGLAAVTSAIDALLKMAPEWRGTVERIGICAPGPLDPRTGVVLNPPDRKSTRLNSSHLVISYAV